MKKILSFTLLIVAIAAGLIFAYREMSQERALEAEGEAPVTAPSRVKRGPDGQVSITLDAATQQLIKLQVASAAPATLAPEVKAYGRVLDPTPLVGLVVELASARASLETSSKELRRVQTLVQDQNASTRALETTEATVTRDQIALEAAQLRLLTAWGKAIAQHEDLPARVKTLAAGETVLVRVDVPAGERLEATPQGARLLPSGAEDTPIEGKFVGPATSADAQAQGRAFLFLAPNEAQRLAPGLSVTAFLKLPGELSTGVLVPASAVVRATGRAWVYEQADADTFTRREIPLDRPLAGGFFVASGMSTNSRLVVTGAQLLLSEELKAQIELVE